MVDGGVLTGPEIEYQRKRGNIIIDPFNQDQINPASYDLRLGSKVAMYSKAVCKDPHRQSLRLQPPEQVAAVLRSRGRYLGLQNEVMDSKEPQEVFEIEMDPKEGFLLSPGIGYLMHTAERVRTDKYVPVLDGKSSIGRLFIAVHVTAGYGDTGFDGQYTLEVVATHPVIVYPGMRFCQIRFHTAVGDVLPYAGNYTGDASMGPVPSRAYNQFK
jgi:dCTP deaminase